MMNAITKHVDEKAADEAGSNGGEKVTADQGGS
jgi:hypothetical protein